MEPLHTPPNLLVIMSDEHAPHFSGAYGHPIVRTPHLDRLASEGVLFENAYCNSPLCGPSRMSFMTGRHAHEIGAWDNSTPLGSDVPTWAHMLRQAGYEVVLSGKQHFVGCDRLHGFDAQIARDLHAEHAHPTFAWDDGIHDALQPWPTLAQAGPGGTTEIEVDDQVEAAALAYLVNPDRHGAPWALNVSFIAPHFPLVVPEPYWSMYEREEIDLPVIQPGHLESQHPVHQRLRRMFGMIDFGDDLVRRGRIGYYGLITWLDDKIGRLLDTLESHGLAENTLVVYVSDHGEMAGEHGMWRKSNFFEHSARIPLVMRWPGRLPAGQRVPEVVSLVDLVATMVDAADAYSPVPLSGESLLPLATGDLAPGAWKDEAFCAYLAHGVVGPMAMLRRGRFKLNVSLGDEPELYDLVADPGEFHSLAGDQAHAAEQADLQARIDEMWDPIDLDRRVRQSQRERLFIEAAAGTSVEASRAAWYASGSTVSADA